MQFTYMYMLHMDSSVDDVHDQLEGLYINIPPHACRHVEGFNLIPLGLT